MGIFSSIAKFPIGGGIRRMATGAFVGGAAGAALSENESGTGTFMDTMRGAALGLGIGALTTKTALSGMGSAAKSALRKTPSMMKAGWGATKFGGRVGVGTAAFTLNNPRTALGIAGVGMGAYTLSSSGMSESNMSDREMEALAMTGGAPSTGFGAGEGAGIRQNARAMFLDSTSGLVQGLHRGRRS